VTERRRHVRNAGQLPVSALVRAGVFRTGPEVWWSCRWKRGTTIVNSLGLRVEGIPEVLGPLRLTYVITRGKQESIECDYRVPLAFTPGPRGAGRWLFRCPVVTGGQSCLRRCEVLYLPPEAERFGCRRCYRLTSVDRWSVQEQAFSAVARAERDLVLASSVDGIARSVVALAAARAALDPQIRTGIEKSRAVVRLGARAEAVLNSPRVASLNVILGLGRKLGRAQKEHLRLIDEILAVVDDEGPLTVEVVLADPGGTGGIEDFSEQTHADPHADPSVNA
jgi:hypothetical protein